MVKRWHDILRVGERGDTLIEVTFALAILAFVLIGATSVVTSSLRNGQTARERTQISNEAQGQMEALRSFRDNHTWDQFRSGLGVTYKGIDTAGGTSCNFDPSKSCFHMEALNTTAGTHEWVPVPGPMAGTVPSSYLEIWADNSAAAASAHDCNYDFELHYGFETIGNSTPSINHIRTRLANLKYSPPAVGPGVCL